MENAIFKRIEKKYLISPKQYSRLMEIIKDRLVPDNWGKSTVLSIYFDTTDSLLIRNSIDAKAYKEKLRLRAYGIADKNTKVFLELKKKYKGVVYKRRQALTLKEAEDYIRTGIIPKDTQIMREIDYFMRFYNHPKPKILIACERSAFYIKKETYLRLTFDENIRYRTENIALNKDALGKEIIPKGYKIMEFKTNSAMPLWLVDAFNECDIKPQKFSKYATAYKEINNSLEKGEYNYA